MHSWRIEQSHGDAGAFHAADPLGDRCATFHTVERPTLVLGSAQPDDTVDEAVAAASGVHIVRRRSGGGAVLLLPGEFVWLDLVVPTGDVLWRDDVGASMLWVGELWQRALASLGEAAGASVHRGALVRSPWSTAVCWAGVGTGELMVGSAKVVGISQRRTRHWVRFQSMCHLHWRPEQVSALVAAPRPTVADLAGAAACVDATELAVSAALVAALP